MNTSPNESRVERGARSRNWFFSPKGWLQTFGETCLLLTRFNLAQLLCVVVAAPFFLYVGYFACKSYFREKPTPPESPATLAVFARLNHKDARPNARVHQFATHRTMYEFFDYPPYGILDKAYEHTP